MKITILGATGNVGRELLSQALESGHEVTVLVRNPEKLGATSSRVTVVQGDVSDANAVERAVAGVEAVLSTLGHTRDSANDVLAVASTNAVKALRKNGGRRIVVLANVALSEPGDQPTVGQKMQRGLMGLAMGQINKDHEAQAKVLADSGLDWTVVRAAVLADGPHTGQYKVGKLDSSAGSKIARADVADFMLKSLNSNTYVRSLPVVSQ